MSDDSIKFFLKFGERKFIQRFADGHLYFTNALTIRKIEKEQHIIGQGDYLEGGSIIVAENVKMVSNETGETLIDGVKANMTVHYAPSNGTPVFCLFACNENDCTLSSDGKLQISLSTEKQKSIREHFPKADTVAIISDPSRFIQDVENSIGTSCISEPIHYFHLKGIVDGDKITNDYQYLMYLTQDSEEKIAPGGRARSFNGDYSFRSLLCKDVFFKDEQEFRFVLNKYEIDAPREFDVYLSGKVDLQPIEYLITK